MNNIPLNILLADDDTDDCFLFKEALEELPVKTELITVNDGVYLIQYLCQNENQLPHVLYLDLNMPRKNGFECLTEIKQHQKLNQIPVIIFSTSFDTEIVNLLYKHGAHYYIRKPAEFPKLSEILLKSIHLIDTNNHQPAKEKFVLT